MGRRKDLDLIDTGPLVEFRQSIVLFNHIKDDLVSFGLKRIIVKRFPSHENGLEFTGTDRLEEVANFTFAGIRDTQLDFRMKNNDTILCLHLGDAQLGSIPVSDFLVTQGVTAHTGFKYRSVGFGLMNLTCRRLDCGSIINSEERGTILIVGHCYLELGGFGSHGAVIYDFLQRVLATAAQVTHILFICTACLDGRDHILNRSLTISAACTNSLIYGSDRIQGHTLEQIELTGFDFRLCFDIPENGTEQAVSVGRNVFLCNIFGHFVFGRYFRSRHLNQHGVVRHAGTYQQNATSFPSFDHNRVTTEVGLIKTCVGEDLNFLDSLLIGCPYSLHLDKDIMQGIFDFHSMISVEHGRQVDHNILVINGDHLDHSRFGDESLDRVSVLTDLDILEVQVRPNGLKIILLNGSVLAKEVDTGGNFALQLAIVSRQGEERSNFLADGLNPAHAYNGIVCKCGFFFADFQLG